MRHPSQCKKLKRNISKFNQFPFIIILFFQVSIIETMNQMKYKFRVYFNLCFWPCYDRSNKLSSYLMYNI